MTVAARRWLTELDALARARRSPEASEAIFRLIWQHQRDTSL
jgi:hypothetical protein